MHTLKGIALVYFLIEKIREKYSNVQIGKTVVQKMTYLLEKERGYDFGFSMYHYGPYSTLISNYLDLAESLGLLKITWDSEKGYFIEPVRIDEKSKIYQTLKENIDLKDQEKINKIVENYGKFSPLAVRLSIVATALYIKENFDVSEKEIIEIVKALKHQYSHLVEETINELKV